MAPGTDLFAQVVAWENLLLAFRKASKGKRGSPEVAGFEYRLEDNLIGLSHELQSGTYLPGAYRSFYIHEPKRRLISAAPFRDRVVHHALCNVIEPIFERTFVHDSFANRVGKGTHRALDRAQQYSRGFRYVLQLDLRQFFPSIDHEILLSELARKIADGQVLGLCELVLRSGAGVLDADYDMVYFPGDDLFALLRPRGLPIGNLTSQFWANAYLNPLDHFIKRGLRCSGYVRYVDDLLLFGDDKDELWAWKAALDARLARLRLSIHRGAHPRPVSEGIPYLGFTIFPERRRLKRRKGVHAQRRLKALALRWMNGELALEDFVSSCRGWNNHAQFANTVGLRRAVFRSLPGDALEALRAYQRSHATGTDFTVRGTR